LGRQHAVGQRDRVAQRHLQDARPHLNALRDRSGNRYAD
jgi:hypothetical protein